MNNKRRLVSRCSRWILSAPTYQLMRFQESFVLQGKCHRWGQLSVWCSSSSRCSNCHRQPFLHALWPPDGQICPEAMVVSVHVENGRFGGSNPCAYVNDPWFLDLLTPMTWLRPTLYGGYHRELAHYAVGGGEIQPTLLPEVLGVPGTSMQVKLSFTTVTTSQKEFQNKSEWSQVSKSIQG